MSGSIPSSEGDWMKRIIIDVDDAYDDAISFTLIGHYVTGCDVLTCAAELKLLNHFIVHENGTVDKRWHDDCSWRDKND